MKYERKGQSKKAKIYFAEFLCIMFGLYIIRPNLVRIIYLLKFEEIKPGIGQKKMNKECSTR